jgi:hypothetical protein
MLFEYLIYRLGWTDVWYAHAGKGTFLDRHSGPRWHVGKWTGPQVDLICTRRCDTNQEAEEALSPSGWTIWHAFILSLLKEMRLRRLERRRMA